MVAQNTNTIRKSITLKEDEYEIIKEYTKKIGMSFSEFLRKSSLRVIKQEEELSLALFMNKHLEMVCDEEQKEIDNLNIDYSNKNGKEVNINDFL
ncbi:MAG: hypothetical protein CSA86_00180 [Arcobacter sp.]|nr:MAG: hypothetical protein CSA86_00180 [Arcobacter sp.]